MDYKRLLSLVEQALNTPAPKAIIDYCGEWYSPYYNLLYLIAKHNGSGLCLELGVEGGRGVNAMSYNTYLIFYFQ